jgi:hypothetical protein
MDNRFSWDGANMTEEKTASPDQTDQIDRQVDVVTPDNFSLVWSYILAEIESGRWDFADWPLENLQEIPLTPDPDGQAVKDLDSWINRHLKPETRGKMFTAINKKTTATTKPEATPATAKAAAKAESAADSGKAKSSADPDKTTSKAKTPAKAEKAKSGAAPDKTTSKAKTPAKVESNRINEFESKKAASEIILSEKTRDRLLQYREQTFGVGKGSMEVAIRQLLDGVERTMPLQAFQKLTAMQRRNNLPSLEATLNKLIELAKKSNESPPGSLSPADCIIMKDEIQQLLDMLKTNQ